jgi:hypothetical protein
MPNIKQTMRAIATTEAARILGLRPFRLRAMQRSGTGPTSIGEGDRIRYEPDAIKQWITETGCVSRSRGFN